MAESHLFESLDGKPINFRLVCRSSVKAQYLAKIVRHGGVVRKSQSCPRLTLIGGHLPCKEGHRRCDLHPPFSAEPAFRLGWVDDCISGMEILDIKAYLLNSSPEYARTDFKAKLLNGWYSSANAHDHVFSEIKLPTDGTSEARGFEEHNRLVMMTCRQRLGLIADVALRREALPTEVNAPTFAGKSDSIIVGSSNTPGITQATSTPKTSRIRNEGIGSLLFSESEEEPLQPVKTNSVSNPTFSLSDAKCEESRAGPSTSTKGQPNVCSRTFSLSEAKGEESRAGPSTSTKGQQNVCSRTFSLSDAKCEDSRAGPSTSTKGQRNELRASTRPSGLLGIHLDDKDLASAIPNSLDSDHSSSDESPAPKRTKLPLKSKITKQTQPASQANNESTSDSDDGFGPPPGSYLKQKGIRQSTREPYTRSEEIAIINYIIAAKKFTGLHSDVIWKAMDGKPGLERRTYHSLKNHFRRSMMPHIEDYNLLTPKQIKSIRSVK